MFKRSLLVFLLAWATAAIVSSSCGAADVGESDIQQADREPDANVDELVEMVIAGHAVNL